MLLPGPALALNDPGLTHLSKKSIRLRVVACGQVAGCRGCWWTSNWVVDVSQRSGRILRAPALDHDLVIVFVAQYDCRHGGRRAPGRVTRVVGRITDLRRQVKLSRRSPVRSGGCVLPARRRHARRQWQARLR